MARRFSHRLFLLFLLFLSSAQQSHGLETLSPKSSLSPEQKRNRAALARRNIFRRLLLRRRKRLRLCNLVFPDPQTPNGGLDGQQRQSGERKKIIPPSPEERRPHSERCRREDSMEERDQRAARERTRALKHRKSGAPRQEREDILAELRLSDRYSPPRAAHHQERAAGVANGVVELQIGLLLVPLQRKQLSCSRLPGLQHHRHVLAFPLAQRLRQRQNHLQHYPARRSRPLRRLHLQRSVHLQRLRLRRTEDSQKIYLGRRRNLRLYSLVDARRWVVTWIAMAEWDGDSALP